MLLTAAGVVTSTSAAPSGKVPRLIFPIVGAVAFANDFGAARYSGTHQGNDLMAIAPHGRRRRRGREGQVLDDVRSRRVHALSLRRQRDDVPLHPPEQRRHEGERQPRQVRPGDVVLEGPARRRSTSRRASRSATSETPATPTPPIRTSTSRCTRTTAAPTNPYPYLMKAERLIFATSMNTTVTLTVHGHGHPRVTRRADPQRDEPPGVSGRHRARQDAPPAAARRRAGRPDRPRQGQGRRRRGGAVARRQERARAHRADASPRSPRRPCGRAPTAPAASC